MKYYIFFIFPKKMNVFSQKLGIAVVHHVAQIIIFAGKRKIAGAQVNHDNRTNL
jgi:hypothetical protein